MYICMNSGRCSVFQCICLASILLCFFSSIQTAHRIRDRGATLRLGEGGGGGGTISDSILGGHKALFLTKSL